MKYTITKKIHFMHPAFVLLDIRMSIDEAKIYIFMPLIE